MSTGHVPRVTGRCWNRGSKTLLSRGHIYQGQQTVKSLKEYR